MSAEKFKQEMLQQEMRKQSGRLHHISMLYVGAIAELAQGKALGILPNDLPGLKKTRDVLDLMLFLRAEMNGLTRILVEKKIVTTEYLTEVFTDEYKHMADEKAKQFGCESTEYGLSFDIGKKEASS